MDSKTILKTVKEYSVMAFALSLYVFSWTAFLIPNEITAGGVTGISSILNYAFGIPISLSYLVINAVLLTAGTIIMGKGFGFKTIFCVLVSTLYFEIFPAIPWVSNIDDNLINSIIGGAMSAAGIALVFTQGGSTGGIDIIALVINKYREVSPGKVFMVSDFLIISSILLLPDKSLQDLVYGYVVTVAFSYTVDQILTGSKQSVQMLIITNKYEEIADKLCYELDKGVTAINSIGWYKKSSSMIIMVVTQKSKMYEVMGAVKEVDPHAFLTVSTVMGVYGEGFEQVKSLKKKKA
ncbi:MAG: YitT family protein [Bacteroidales bacterium]|nr:YitT family protein [Bacteroidales bacterium]MBQ7017522.1 YitT family protein [Bacteroidales bacterium]